MISQEKLDEINKRDKKEKAEKKDKLEKKIEFLSKFLPIEKIKPSKEIKMYFNLFYAKGCIPLKISSKFQDFFNNIVLDKDSLAQVYAIVLSCNSQNVDIFLKMDKFLEILRCVAPIDNFSHKNQLELIEIMQVTILLNLDSKLSRTILKYIKTIRNGAIISIHIQKCLEMVLNLYINTESKKENILDFNYKTLATLDIPNSIFTKQNNCLKDIKELLNQVSWTKSLSSIFLDSYQKTILFLGRKKSGKATLIGTMLYRNKFEEKFDSISPISFDYGKNSCTVRYLNESDLKSLTDSPNKQVLQIVNNALQNFKDEYTQEAFTYNTKQLQEIYENNKIQIVKNINIFKDIEILKYVTIINTPSIPLTTYRHLQLDRYIISSDFVCYLINAASVERDLNEDAKYLSDVLLRDNILKVFIIFTKIDKSNFTIKKIKSSYIFLKDTIETILNKKDYKLLDKLEVHFTASNIAYELRVNKTSSNIDFDIYSSGLPELERSIVNNVFNTGISNATVGPNNFDISILKDILLMLSNPSNAELTYEELAKIKSNILNIKSNYKNVIKDLSFRNTELNGAIANLKDNLHYQLIDSLNFLLKHKKSRNSLNIKKLKKTTVGSLMVALQSLSDILKQSFIDNKNLKIIINTLSPASKDSMFVFCKSGFHKDIMNIIYENLVQIVGGGYSTHRTLIIANHFSNYLDTILRDEMNLEDFKDDYYIKPLKGGFEYYFATLQRNLDSLFANRVRMFQEFCEKVILILESIFIHYFSDKSFNKNASKFLEIFQSRK